MAFDYVNAVWKIPRSNGSIIKWKGGNVPSDSHPCGFHNDLCDTPAKRLNTTVVALVVACLVIAVALTAWCVEVLHVKKCFL